MRVIVVGAGPVGCVMSIALARGGHQVSVVDRDTGPEPDGTWARRGVMQFRHPHGFRPNVNGVLSQLMPDVWQRVVDAGCVPVTPPGAPGFVVSLCARRATFERALRAALSAEPGVAEVAGRAEAIVSEGGRLVGARVDGVTLETDCVVVATGRGGHLGEELRAPAEQAAAGMSYVSRMYRARAG